MHPTAYVHPEATLIGRVQIGPGCYIGPGARLRADWCTIVVGPGSNVQENCVVHARPDATVTLGPASHIGHGAIVHGATLGEHVMIGMGAIVQDDVTLGDGCLVAAGALVTGGTQAPPRSVLMGVPARITGQVDAEREERLWSDTRIYQQLPARYGRPPFVG